MVRLSATVPDFPTVLYCSRICDRPLLSPTELSPLFPTSPLSPAVSSCMLLCPTVPIVLHCSQLSSAVSYRMLLSPTVSCASQNSSQRSLLSPDCLQLPPTIPSHCSFLFLLSPIVLHLLSPLRKTALTLVSFSCSWILAFALNCISALHLH